MKVVIGNLWNSKADLIAVTTNATLMGSSRALVMGRGAAFQASQRYTRLPGAAGRAVEDNALTYIGPMPVYGFIVVKVKVDQSIGLFQVKLHFHDDARLSLIGVSVACLIAWLEKYPRCTVAMNYPGIGNGHLDRQSVEPLVSELPDQVSLYMLSVPDG